VITAIVAWCGFFFIPIGAGGRPPCPAQYFTKKGRIVLSGDVMWCRKAENLLRAETGEST